MKRFRRFRCVVRSHLNRALDPGTSGRWRRVVAATEGVAFVCAMLGITFSLDAIGGESSAGLDPLAVRQMEQSFAHGREYFVLRSGRAKLVAQADQVDFGPAFLFLLFDAEQNRQTARKTNALNFEGGIGFLRSAVEVDLGGFAFTALGHQTRTRWMMEDGLPTVEAVWWAGGLKVTERLTAVGREGLFRRRVALASVNLGGQESVNVRFRLPVLHGVVRDGWLVSESANGAVGLRAVGPGPASGRADRGCLEVGPISVSPGQVAIVDSLMAVAMAGHGALPVVDLERDWAAARRQAELSSWLRTEDATVRDIFDKARFGLPGMVADNGVMDAGMFEYGAQWVRDTSNTLLGMVHAGHFELARSGFQHVLTHMVNPEGNAMIAGAFDQPDLEQFDQMGELVHSLKAFCDWTGDDTLVRQNRARLLALIERPLRPEFRDATGMVHNRREFWERTLDDAYELAYQTYVILGLRDAVALAASLGAEDRVARWSAEADRIQDAMLSHPTRSLVEDGRLIKRRSVTGERVDAIRFPAAAPDVPLKTESVHLANPDATMALPIAFGLVDPRSALARGTLDELERLWEARWFGGGYERYHSSGQCDQPGPWTFASCFVLRAQHEAGDYRRSRRTLEWLNTVQGGRTGAWFEEVPLVRSQAPTAGILPWTSGEVSLFVVRHLLGVRFEGGETVLKPALYPGSGPVRADLRYRKGRLVLEIPGAGLVDEAFVDGRRWVPDAFGAVRLPAGFGGGTVRFHLREKRGER
jgi:hypothetical protein